MQILCGGTDELGRGAVGTRHASAIPVLTEIAVPGHTEGAFAAVERRVERDGVSGCHVADSFSDAHHRSSRFMSGNDRKHRRCELTVQYVKIGSADPDCLDLNHGLPRSWHRIWTLRQREVARPREHDRSHYRPQVKRFAEIIDAPRVLRLLAPDCLQNIFESLPRREASAAEMGDLVSEFRITPGNPARSKPVDLLERHSVICVKMDREGQQ
jgi:hypothetical protein